MDKDTQISQEEFSIGYHQMKLRRRLQLELANQTEMRFTFSNTYHNCFYNQEILNNSLGQSVAKRAFKNNEGDGFFTSPFI